MKKETSRLTTGTLILMVTKGDLNLNGQLVTEVGGNQAIEGVIRCVCVTEKCLQLSDLFLYGCEVLQSGGFS